MYELRLLGMVMRRWTDFALLYRRPSQKIRLQKEYQRLPEEQAWYLYRAISLWVNIERLAMLILLANLIKLFYVIIQHIPGTGVF